jgi:hypothetical protein
MVVAGLEPSVRPRGIKWRSIIRCNNRASGISGVARGHSDLYRRLCHIVWKHHAATLLEFLEVHRLDHLIAHETVLKGDRGRVSDVLEHISQHTSIPAKDGEFGCKNLLSERNKLLFAGIYIPTVHCDAEGDYATCFGLSIWEEVVNRRTCLCSCLEPGQKASPRLDFHPRGYLAVVESPVRLCL